MKGVNVNSNGHSQRIPCETEKNRQSIKEKLHSSVGIDGDVDHNTCEQCASLQNEMTHLSCEKCSDRVGVCMCDICSKDLPSIYCDIRNWSPMAKRMIPSACHAKSTILICSDCNATLNRKASLSWNVCRFCAQESTNLENFLSTAYQQVREVFHSATRIKFSLVEGLPSFICLACKDQLLAFGKFYCSFVAAQATLKKIHANLFIGGSTPRKRTSTSKDLSALAESNGVAAIKQARGRSRSSSTTTRRTSASAPNLNDGTLPTNFGQIAFSHDSNIVQRTSGGVQRDQSASLQIVNAAQPNLGQDPMTAGRFVISDVTNLVQTNGSDPRVEIYQANSNTSPSTSNAAQLHFGPVTTVGPFIITEVGHPNKRTGYAGPGPTQNLNRSLPPSYPVHREVTMASTSSSRIAEARSNEVNALGNQIRTNTSPRNNKSGDLPQRISKLGQPCLPKTRRIEPKPAISTSTTLNERSRSIIRQVCNANQSNTGRSTGNVFSFQPKVSQQQPLRQSSSNSVLQALLNRPPMQVNPSPIGHFSAALSTAAQSADLNSGTRKPPQRRMTIHNLAVPTATATLSQKLVTTRSSQQTLVEIGKSTASWPIILKKGTRKPPQRRLTIHNLSVPSPRDSVVGSQSNAPQTEVQMRPIPSSSPTKIVAKKPTRYYVALKSGEDSPAPGQTPAPKKAPPRRMTIHHLPTPNCPSNATPLREMQPRPKSSLQTESAAARRYYVALKGSEDSPAPTEKPAPLRQRRQTEQHSVTPICPILQVPSTEIETIVIRDDTPPREEVELPKPSSSRRSIPASTIKRPSRKPPARRKTISVSTSRQLARTPSPEVIDLSDDSPPRETHGYASDAMMFRPDAGEPLLETEIALNASLLIDDGDEPEQINSQEDLNADDACIELMSPSALINYAINKAYNSNGTTPVPRRRTNTVGASIPTCTSSQEQSIDNRRSLRIGSKITSPKTAETNLRLYRKGK